MKRTFGLALLALIVSACSSGTPPRGTVQSANIPYSSAPNTSQQRANILAYQGPFQPNLHLYTCRKNMSNRPATTADQRVVDYAPLILVNGVVLATAPANDVCLSSGFGPRYGRPHKGIDLFANPTGPIYSGSSGIIREVTSSRGYGNQIVIDHGRGVYTRYAHLASFAPGIKPGAKIGFGVELGRMGATGNATGPHLHYEVLTGNYWTQKKSFGLHASNPLAFPRWAGLNTVS